MVLVLWFPMSCPMERNIRLHLHPEHYNQVNASTCMSSWRRLWPHLQSSINILWEESSLLSRITASVGYSMSKKGLPPLAAARLQRWAILLSAYNHQLQFKLTDLHGNADGLCLPLQSESHLGDRYYSEQGLTVCQTRLAINSEWSHQPHASRKAAITVEYDIYSGEAVIELHQIMKAFYPTEREAMGFS